MKKCPKCGIEKPLTAEYYHRRSDRPIGFVSQCKVCVSEKRDKEKSAEYYQKNKERIAARRANYYRDNKEKFAEKSAEYYQKNKESLRLQKLEYYSKNREEILKRSVEYRKNNKEKIDKYQDQYRKNNKEKIAEKNYKYYQNNKEKIAKQGAEYYQNNKEKIRKQAAEYRKNNKEKIRKQAAGYYQDNKEKFKKQAAELRKQKSSEQPACVYQIINLANGKIYIGETLRGEIRWKGHLRALRGNRHNNHRLQEDYNKFGEEAFEWSIIKEVDKDKDTLLLEEIKTIDRFLREGKELYNLSLTIDQLKLLMENK